MKRWIKRRQLIVDVVVSVNVLVLLDIPLVLLDNIYD
jgi:hypothetical protein